MLARLRPRDVYVPLLVLVAVGVALRLVTMVLYSTVVTDYYTGDSGRFIRVGYSGIFEDEWQPSGYALFLAGIRSITSWLPVTVAVQHLLGLLTGLVLYATVRRAGGSRGVALVPAAVVLLSGDHLFLEHAFLTETLWLALIALGLYAAVRGGIGGDLRWLAAGSALLGLSAIERNVSLLLPVVVALWAVWVARPRVAAGAVALVPAVVVVAGYSVLAGSIGTYTGLGDMKGWSLYQRVGQFADCSKFTPPEGTSGLCDARPVGHRPGPFYWYFDLTAPARTVFPAMSPKEDGKVGAFAREAILHQPLDYARTVAKDLARYVDYDIGFDRPASGQGPAGMSFRRTSPDPANTANFAVTVRKRYSGLDPTPDAGAGFLTSYQNVFRTHGALLVILVLLSLAGMLRGPRDARRASVLFAAAAALLLVLPPAVSSYEGRYAIPPAALLAVPAAFGVASLLRGRATVPGPIRARTATNSP